MEVVLLLVLIIMLLASLPRWPYSLNWGYYPSVAIGLLLVIVIVLMLMRII